MKKVFTAFLLAGVVAVLVLATPAFACACGPLPSAQQGSGQQGSGSSGDTVKYVVSPNDPCTWPKDIRPANCPAPS
jgi:hypothetical protein